LFYIVFGVDRIKENLMATSDLGYLATNLAEVQRRIKEAATRAGRNLQDIKLVGVSKTVGRAELIEMWRLGLHNFGENRIADAEAKFANLSFTTNNTNNPEITTKTLSPALHLIGHLQTNKAKRAVALFDWIHSVDSLHLAQTLNRYAELERKRIPILLQVNVAGEESKEGMSPAELPDILEAVLKLEYVTPRGLMTIAPNFPQAEQTRPIFRDLGRLFESYKQIGPQWSELSMGMTNDFEVAIEEGATLIRVGRALFQPKSS
jgi:pyridoxal phosphate enzyme (YggS family)